MEGTVWNKPETNSLHAYMAARNEAIINLRVLAVLIVVIGHCIIIFDPAWSRPMGYESLYPSGFLVSVKRLINLFQMELFFSISGFCFYYSIHKVSDFGHFVLNKACRLIIPFIATGMLWQIPLRAIARYNGFADKNILQIWEAFFTLKDCGHLWFLPVLFFLFLISYLLLKTHRKAIWVVPFIAAGLYALYVRLPGDFQISNIAKYLIFFLLGYYLNLSGLMEKIKGSGWNKFATVLSYLIIAGTVVMVCVFDTDIRNYMTSGIISALFVVGLYLVIPSRSGNLTKWIDKNSFGIYLFHSPVLYLGYRYLGCLPPYLYVPLQFVICIGVSLMMIWLLRKLHLGILIGEK